MELVHGPFTAKHREGPREDEHIVLEFEHEGVSRSVYVEQIASGECHCRTCREHGTRGMPESWMFLRTDPDGADGPVLEQPIWIAERPNLDLDTGATR